jgi:hypothetical protein
MPGFAPYLVAGGLVLLTMDFAAPPAGVGVPITAWPSIDDSALQVVNRAAKGDRLMTLVAKHPPARAAQHVLVGCEPVFSPLSAAAQLNFPGRCIA